MTSQKSWTETTLDKAVNEVVSSGLFDQPILEARPVWHIEGAILIAECRAGAARYWLVAGADSPTDIIPAHVASTAREVAQIGRSTRLNSSHSSVSRMPSSA